MVLNRVVKKIPGYMFTIMDITLNKVYNSEHMKDAKYTVSKSTKKYLEIMGEQIKLSRLRRNLPSKLVCERACISRTSLWKVEKGDPSVAIGIYGAVLHALNGMDNEFLNICGNDDFGRQIQDIELLEKRASRR